MPIKKDRLSEAVFFYASFKIGYKLSSDVIADKTLNSTNLFNHRLIFLNLSGAA